MSDQEVEALFVLETQRLMLKLLTKENLISVMSFWGDPEVMAYCGGPGDEARELRAIDYYAVLHQKMGYSVYGVFNKETCSLMGACGFNPGEREGEAELIYHFAKPFWGKGYAFEAAKACIVYICGIESVEKLLAVVEPENAASAKVLDKLGFENHGLRLREGQKQQLLYYTLSLKNVSAEVIQKWSESFEGTQETLV